MASCVFDSYHTTRESTFSEGINTDVCKLGHISMLREFHILKQTCTTRNITYNLNSDTDLFVGTVMYYQNYYLSICGDGVAHCFSFLRFLVLFLFSCFFIFVFVSCFGLLSASCTQCNQCHLITNCFMTFPVFFNVYTPYSGLCYFLNQIKD